MKWKLRAIAWLLAPVSLAPAQESKPADTAATVVLEGQVVDLRGEPVPMASVVIVTEQQRDQVLAKTMCDGEGCFRLGRVPRRASWIVRAESPGRCAGEGQITGEPKPLRIAVHDAATVRGVLRRKEGAPVSGAVVRAQLQGVDRGLCLVDSPATDAEGRFALAAVPLGFVRLSAVVPGEGLAEVETVVRGDTEVTLGPLQRATTTLEVLVEGMPKEALGQLRLELLAMSVGKVVTFPEPWDRPRFDQAGRVELQFIPNWTYQVVLSAPGFAILPRYGNATMNQGPHRLQFKATVPSLLQCPVVVRDDRGLAVAGLRLRVRSGDRTTLAEATSDEEGKLTFALALAAGNAVAVESLDDRFVLDQDRSNELSSRLLGDHACKVDPSAAMELRVAAACSVQGRVLLADGRPAAFVAVDIAEWVTVPMGQWMTPLSVTTDRHGNYRFGALHHVRRPVQLSVKGFCGPGTSDELSLEKAGTRLELPDLKLEPPAVVEGTVTDALGKPAPGIRVCLCRRDFEWGRQHDAFTEVITDRQGRYRFLGVRRGEAWLQLVDEAATEERAVPPFEVEAGKTCRHDLKLPKP